MPRPVTTPTVARLSVAAHLAESRDAIATLDRALSGAPTDPAALVAAARKLEAAGCYARRVATRGLLA